MSDTINRRDAINALDCDITITGKENADVVVKTIQSFVDRIKALPPAQQWIPCSERLPEKKVKSYLICTDGGYICECRWTNANVFWSHLTSAWHWNIFDIPQYSRVVAWQPFPEPYREEHG